MASSARASIVVPVPPADVWQAVRRFSFPLGIIKDVVAVDIESGSDLSIGAVRLMRWADGQWMRHRLLELDEANMRSSWELIGSEPESEVAAQISTLSCLSVTEDNHTFVRWEVEFSSGTSADLLRFHHVALQQNLYDLYESLTGKAIPTLKHVHEGPSSRVIWAAHELGIPLHVTTNDIELADQRGSLVNSAESHLFHPTANVMPTFSDDGIELIESGNILLYLLDRYDHHYRLYPPAQSNAKERARFRLWFFFTAATCDPLLLEAYLHQFVLSGAASNADIIESNKSKWFDAVKQRFEPALQQHPYIIGEHFSMADVMVGHTIYFASMLGWIEPDSILANYLARLKRRHGFQRAYLSNDL